LLNDLSKRQIPRNDHAMPFDLRRLLVVAFFHE